MYGTNPILHVDRVSKSYASLLAVNQISFAVQAGEIFALLGPNGAGKTTLINCITGLISRFDGSISVAGHDVRKDAHITRSLIGFVPQELNFDGFFSVEEVLTYQSGFFNTQPKKEKIEQVLSDFGLLEKRKTNTRKLSGGMKRRLMICKALMHDPVLMFLDEPTAGVDVELRDELWEYVERLKTNGTTIILTTHYLEEAEQLADQVGIIKEGELIALHSHNEMMTNYGKRWNLITVKDPIEKPLKSRLMELNYQIPESNQVRIEGPLKSSDENSALLQALDILREHDHCIANIEGGRNSLENIFKEIVNAKS